MLWVKEDQGVKAIQDLGEFNGKEMWENMLINRERMLKAELRYVYKQLGAIDE